MQHHNTIGMDLGDKKHLVCTLDHQGNEVNIKTICNTRHAITKFMRAFEKAVVVIEASTHSPWISRLLDELGHTVYVGNPRKLRFIWDGDDKTDKRDARMLAAIGRFNPALLSPIEHRSENAQRDLQLIKAREMLVEVRTKLVNHVRCIVKSFGERLPSGWSTKAFAKKALVWLPQELQPTLAPLLQSIQEASDKIASYDKAIEEMAAGQYSETKKLMRVHGVGALTALAFVLTIDDAHRFKKSRDVGAFLGLVPRRDQSGASDKQLRITKAGNRYLRKLLVNCAQYVLGRFGEDCTLRRHGLKIAARGGKNAKKRASTAVARKLAVLLHRLWVSDEAYDPFYNPSGQVAMLAG